MEAVGADDVVAVDAHDLVAAAIGDVGLVALQIVRRHVLGVVDDHALQTVARLVQVLGQLGLAVHHHRAAAAVLVQIDPLHLAVVGDEEAFVDLAFAVHALAALRLAHQRGEAVLQHAGADAAEHVLAALPLQHDGVDALQVQQLRQQQPRRAAADDANLGLHACLLHGVVTRPNLRREAAPAEWPHPSTTCTFRTCAARRYAPTACSARRRTCRTRCTSRPSPRAPRCTTGSWRRTATCACTSCCCCAAAAARCTWKARRCRWRRCRWSTCRRARCMPSPSSAARRAGWRRWPTTWSSSCSARRPKNAARWPPAACSRPTPAWRR